MDIRHRYTEQTFNKKVLIIGLFPPPLGGIAVHIDRVKKKLVEQDNIVLEIDVIKETKKRSKIGYFLYLIDLIYKQKPEIIYYHTLSLRKLPIELLILVFIKKIIKSKLIIINHTPRFFYEKSWLYKKAVNFLLNFVNKQILIGDSTYKAYIDNNMSLKNKSFSIESPYLLPNLFDKDLIFVKYPEMLKMFLNKYFPLILINGSAARKYNNTDLYGFDMAIKMLDYLKNDFNNCGLIVVMAEKGNKNYFESIYNQIKSKKNIYLLLACQEEIWPLFTKINLFIRPTNSDAYGISIQEAIDLGVPAIASNVCKRPQGTVLFESRNQNELNEKAKLILSKNFVFKNEVTNERTN